MHDAIVLCVVVLATIMFVRVAMPGRDRRKERSGAGGDGGFDGDGDGGGDGGGGD